MPSFTNTLVGMGPICDAGYKVTLTEHDVNVYSPIGRPDPHMLAREENDEFVAISLCLTGDFYATANVAKIRVDTISRVETTRQSDWKIQGRGGSKPQANSSYNLPSLEALVWYLPVVAGLPTMSTWLKSIKAGNFATWPGMTYSNASKYFPEPVETIKRHTTQSCQGVRSTKKKAETKSP